MCQDAFWTGQSSQNRHLEIGPVRFRYLQHRALIAMQKHVHQTSRLSFVIRLDPRLGQGGDRSRTYDGELPQHSTIARNGVQPQFSCAVIHSSRQRSQNSSPICLSVQRDKVIYLPYQAFTRTHSGPSTSWASSCIPIVKLIPRIIANSGSRRSGSGIGTTAINSW